MHRIILTISILFSLINSTWAINLSDYEPFDYRVYFTNPECRLYPYNQTVLSNDGTVLNSRPKNVFCKASDFELNEERSSSPHFQLSAMINDKELKEISLAFLSFSNKQIADELCNAIKKRNLKVSFIIDSNNEDRNGARELLDKISKCKPDRSILMAGEEPSIPQTFFRGNVKGLGFAHNKIILAKYNDPNKVKIVFGSGNMSAGTILHHENWHFITTSPKSYFAQAHECVLSGMLDKANSRKEYVAFIKKCRGDIKASPEEDIRFFIVPSDGKETMNTIVSNIEKAEAIDVAVHRYYHADFRAALESAASNKVVRFVADDDIYWTGKLGRRVGSNMLQEYGHVNSLFRAGGQIFYMETNQDANLIHHNKFVIFHFENDQGAVHTGAGNFTKAAFNNNFENFYFIKIPKIYQAFKRQYEHVIHDLASSWDMLPQEYVNP